MGSEMCIRDSTLWFAHGVDALDVPVWLPLACGLVAHGSVDLFAFVTDRDLRMTVLPVWGA